MLAELTEVLLYERLQPRLRELGLTPAEVLGYALNLASVVRSSRG
jgi:hypothetical protein